MLDTQRAIGPNPKINLLSVGAGRTVPTQVFNGSSIQRRFSSAAREVLGPRILRVIETGEEISDDTISLGSKITTRVIPLLDPVDQVTKAQVPRVTAVLAFYGDRGQSIPPPPVGGVWHGRVPREISAEQPRAYWSEGVFELFGIETPPLVDAMYPRGIWRDAASFFRELIPPEWRESVYTAYDHIFKTASDDLLSRIYERRLPDGTLRTHRMFGRPYVDEPGPYLVARGYTGEVIRPNDLDEEFTTDQLGATFLSTTDQAICVVNLRAQHIYSVSTPFRQLGLALGRADSPADGLGEGMLTCHHDDRALFDDLLVRAANKPLVRLPQTATRFSTVAGRYRTLNLAAAGVPSRGSRTSHLVICYLTDVESKTPHR